MRAMESKDWVDDTLKSTRQHARERDAEALAETKRRNIIKRLMLGVTVLMASGVVVAGVLFWPKGKAVWVPVGLPHIEESVVELAPVGGEVAGELQGASEGNAAGADGVGGGEDPSGAERAATGDDSSPSESGSTGGHLADESKEGGTEANASNVVGGDDAKASGSMNPDSTLVEVPTEAPTDTPTDTPTETPTAIPSFTPVLTPAQAPTVTAIVATLSDDGAAVVTTPSLPIVEDIEGEVR
jgi:hypothetical protein